ncbi:uncharacterized protein LOC118186197 isoform X2 [Stegodyphus dumicola]|uniref:uncharacterized protein LOC118186197 isoform X2 n=1 Tax=Stegodyphus dumicola TaxID=202533 RepID=UPI0015AC73F7|nr:uncharacterized protein LOC118186197 isoform X2 [Stegodyphus dumicola]
MKYSLLLVSLLYGASVFPAAVTEFPLVTVDGNLTEDATEGIRNPQSSDLDSEYTKNGSLTKISESSNSSIWESDSNPIFKAIRDFWLQVKPLGPETGKLLDENTENAMKMIEQSLIEATTMFLKTTEDSDFATLTTDFDSPTVLKVESNTPTQPIQERVGFNILSSQNKHQPVLMVANSTSACSSCYESLHSCVQKCFTENNCNDIQRNAKKCPSPATRLCNPFTQWSPVDECKDHEDCRSPLLCCSDGCINKCVPGVWRS